MSKMGNETRSPFRARGWALAFAIGCVIVLAANVAAAAAEEKDASHIEIKDSAKGKRGFSFFPTEICPVFSA